MISLFFRNLIFTILQPGIVICLFPYLIASEEIKTRFSLPFGFSQYAGLIFFFLGWCLVLYCIYRFAVEGKGTLSPADQTKNLVVKGLYQYSRNPMYIGVMLALIGEVIFTNTNSLLIYTACVFIMFNLFVKFVEEPRLRRDFGDQYNDYCKKVRRWV